MIINWQLSMNKKNQLIILAMIPIIVTIGSISTLPAPAFADTVKCKDNGDNNCNNTTIVQEITINNNCNIINENNDIGTGNITEDPFAPIT